MYVYIYIYIYIHRQIDRQIEIYVEKDLCENIQSIEKVYRECIKTISIKICTLCKKCIQKNKLDF